MNLGPETFTCIAQFTAYAGQEHALQAALMALIEPTQQEAGCISYHLHQSRDNPAHFTMVEYFKDAAAFEYHSQQPYLQDLRAKLPQLAEHINVTTYQLCA